MVFTHLQRFRVLVIIKTGVFPVIKEYIRRTVRSYCGVIADVLSMRTAVSGIICDDHI